MKKRGIILGVIALAAFPQAHASDCYGGPPPKPGFTLQDVKADLDAKADALNSWWLEGRPSQMTESEATAERQRRIDEVYENLAEQRRGVYTAAVCTFKSTKRCASTPGRRHTCPITENAPSRNTEFVMAQLSVIGDDFDRKPSGDPKLITYTVKKTGRGSNTGGFSVPVRYTDAAIDGFIEQDISPVRDYFQSLVAISGTRGVVIRDGSRTPSNRGDCPDLTGTLVKLKELRDAGDLTEQQYRAAVDAEIKRCG